MNPLQAIQDLEQALQTPAHKNIPAADGPLAGFEQAIDQLVAQRNATAKDIQKASVEKAKWEAEKLAAYRKKLAYLESQVEAARVALAASEGSSASPAQDPNQLLDFKKQELAYWQGKLRQIGPPQDDPNVPCVTLEP
ncbi:MAG TPA: hypothetical protein VHE12_09895 [bacterium]|nr:hypothetical protein [bacterium]